MKTDKMTWNIYGQRAFSVAGPMVWNTLPDFIQDSTISAECLTCLLTRNPAVAERPRDAMCHSILQKCSTNGQWITFKKPCNGEWSSRSLKVTGVGVISSSYMISCYSSIVSMPLSCTVFEILTAICQNFKTSLTWRRPHPLEGQFVIPTYQG